MMSTFIPGLELSRQFYFGAVRPLLDEHFPNLPHAAAQIGTGSDILGFDTEMSTDHDWSPAVTLYLNEDDWQRYAHAIHQLMGNALPFEFMGYPVHTAAAEGEDAGTSVMLLTKERPIQHSVWTVTVKQMFMHHLAWNIDVPLTPVDWLTIPSQLLRGFTAGAVYFDNIGEISRIRDALRWYPQDVWLYMLAAAWLRIEALEPLVGRTGDIGDELGSSLIGARLVQDIIRLCFLMEKQYAPYAKWFGSAFRQLACAAELTPHLLAIQHSSDWHTREQALVQVYTMIARMHNALQLTETLAEVPTVFRRTRPYRVIHGERFAQALMRRISDPRLVVLLDRSIIGNIDQWSDHDDLRMMISTWRAKLVLVYE